MSPGPGAAGSNEGEARVMSARHKTRLAIGFFSGANGLSHAVEELVSTGITTTRINMLSTLDNILPSAVPAGACPQVSALPAPFVRAFAEDANSAYDRAMEFLAGIAANLSPASDGATAAKAANGSPPGGAPAAESVALAGRSYLDRQMKRLRDHLLAGGTILVVHLLSPDEHQRVCTTLLQHSGNDVQTHELTIAA